jgi:hypothetical protein
MATTTNYGWTTPDDTALVKDGAAAIRSLGTAIDTTVFNNAGAAIAKTLIDAKGDLIVGSAADTVARLAVGTNGYTLVADSAESVGMRWAAPAGGGLTLLETKTFDNTASTYTFSSISGTYTHLVIIGESMQSALSSGSDTDYLNVRFNNNSSSDYVYSRIRLNSTSLSGSSAISATSFLNLGGVLSDTDDNTAGRGGVEIFIPNYAGTTNYKYFYSRAVGAKDGASSGLTQHQGVGQWVQTSAITSITFVSEYGVNIKAGTLKLYGVK